MIRGFLASAPLRGICIAILGVSALLLLPERVGRTGCIIGDSILFYRTPSGLHAFVEQYQPPDDLDIVADLRILPTRTYYTGIWGRTARVDRCYVLKSAALSALETASILPAAIRAIDQSPAPKSERLCRMESMLHRGVTRDISPLVSGYILNAISSLAATLLVFNLGITIRRSMAAGVRRRRASQGLCPHCGYDCCGDTLPNCPECGMGEAAQHRSDSYDQNRSS
jgi:hypothetical protein